MLDKEQLNHTPSSDAEEYNASKYSPSVETNTFESTDMR